MIDISMEKIESDEVNELYGLSLCVAFAIHVKKWKWFSYQEDVLVHFLLDAPLSNDKKPNKKCGRYVGDNHYVFKDLPKYNENLIKMFNYGQIIENAGYGSNYSQYVEEELNNSNHISLLQASADVRCRAILKLFLDNKNLEIEFS